ncbi:MAG: hypothetical protein KQ78_01396 [Candidatus Izimaplasma bacterium HR2]|nr:MAG: hypothetical protein KQ78_01396 [Candidatus Izimaplasma bacterium HR2]
MNSQFKNSNLGFYLYAAIIAIIAFASIFVVWYMVKGYSLGTYGEGTIIGSVYIGGLKEEEVEPIITERITKWLNDESIVFELTYQGYNYEFNRSLFYFDQELSIFNLEDGETNRLYATYQVDERQDILNDINSLDFLIGINEQFDYETLINDTLIAAGFMKSYSSLNLEDYIIDIDVTELEVGSFTLDIYDGIDVDDLLSGINAVYPDGKIIAEQKELFDIVEKLGENLADNEMSILSTGMLALILETNFAVNEVHYVAEIDYINYDIDTFPYFGHNASINQVIGNSFSFYNPNNYSYYFTVEKVDELSITITLVGLEFIDDIEVQINRTVLDHITQYTPNDDILQSGYDGAIIEVVRVITDISGNVRYENVILFEFYPPIKEIVLEP